MSEMNNNITDTDNNNNGATINKLTARIRELEAENSRLFLENGKQNQVISKLVKRLQSVDPEFLDWSETEMM